MKAFITTALSALLFSVVAADDQPKCGSQRKCDKYSPCCTNDGWCGKGYMFCGINCNDNGNYNQTKCLKPTPCKSMQYKFNDASKFATVDEYVGNYNKHEWLIRAGDYEVKNGNLLLKSSKKTGGTRIEATRYLEYGKITARMKTADSPGIVSSFITMSDVHDEIDWEWVGRQLDEGQSNYFWKGDVVLGNGGKHKISTKSSDEFHDYTINWSPDSIEWGIDGNIIRTLKASDKDGKLPNTPSRIMFSIWSTAESPQGTQEWAGGAINYDSPQYKNNGYFNIEIESLSVECTGPNLSSDDDFKNYLNDQNGVDLEEKKRKEQENEEKRKNGEQVDDEDDDSKGNTKLPSSAWTMAVPVTKFGPNAQPTGKPNGTSDAITNTVSYLAFGLVSLLFLL